MTLSSFRAQMYKNLMDHFSSLEIDSFFGIILMDILGLSKIDVALHPEKKIDEDKSLRIESIIKGLMDKNPIQYLIGFTHFMDLKIKVNTHVLIPRPETEQLVDWILSTFKNSQKTESLEVLDIGTGSGAIAIALSKKLKKSEIDAIEISKKSIEIARENAKINEVNVNFLHQDILKTEKLDTQYDVIVSNPPYVRIMEKSKMQKNVLDFEPHLALFVPDEDPLLFYRKITRLAKIFLKPNGMLFYEINQYLSDDVEALLKKEGFKNIEIRRDMLDNQRMVKTLF